MRSSSNSCLKGIRVRSTSALEFRLGATRHGVKLPGDWNEQRREAFLGISPDRSGHAGLWLWELVGALADIGLRHLLGRNMGRPERDSLVETSTTLMRMVVDTR